MFVLVSSVFQTRFRASLDEVGVPESCGELYDAHMQLVKETDEILAALSIIGNARAPDMATDGDVYPDVSEAYMEEMERASELMQSGYLRMQSFAKYL